MPNGLLLRRGRHYISLVADGMEKRWDPLVFARIIIDKIPPVESELPDWASLFGSAGRREGLVYYAKAHGEVPLSGEMFVRKKSLGGVEYDVYYSRRASQSAAAREFMGLLEQGKEGFVLSSAGRRQLAFRPRTDGGYIFAARFDDLIFGLLRAENLVDGNAAIDLLFRELPGTTGD